MIRGTKTIDREDRFVHDDDDGDRLCVLQYLPHSLSVSMHFQCPDLDPSVLQSLSPTTTANNDISLPFTIDRQGVTSLAM